MKIFLLIILIVISISLISLILLQQRGGGIGSVFGGGGGGSGDAFRSRRGVEKMLHNLTVVLVILYASIAFGMIFID